MDQADLETHDALKAEAVFEVCDDLHDLHNEEVQRLFDALETSSRLVKLLLFHLLETASELSLLEVLRK